MEIVRVMARNVKGISYVEILPKQYTVIGGRNGQGKSSLLDAIAYTLGGAALCPSEPIRKGQDEAECEVEVGGDTSPYVVKRRWYIGKDGEVKTTLSIRTKEGLVVPSPQSVLDRITGKLGFDPCRFMTMKPKEQNDELRSLVGLDTTELDLRRDNLYESRTIANRQAADLKARVDAMPCYQGLQPVEICKLQQDLEAANANNAKIEQDANDRKVALKAAYVELTKRQNQVERIAASQKSLAAEIERYKAAIATAEAAMVSLAGEKALADGNVASQTSEVQALELACSDPLVKLDVQPIINAMKSAEHTNEKVRQNSQRNAMVDELQKIYGYAKELSVMIEDVDRQKQELLAKSEWPVDGLGISDETVTYRGIPFDQCSAAERRLVSFSIGLKAAKSPFMFIHDGALLDDASMRHFASMAHGAGVQLFVERVGEGDECHIVIEGGAVSRADDRYVEEAV